MISKDLGPGVIMLCHMHLDCYAYLGIKFMYNGSWDAHLKDIIQLQVSVRLIIY